MSSRSDPEILPGPPDTESFVPSPEQQQIVGLLERLLGSAFANRYKDFCRLTSGTTGLRASKPMAAHALRELDSMMRVALVVPMEAKAVENKEDIARLKDAVKSLRSKGYGPDSLQRATKALKPQHNHAAEIKLIGARLGLSEDSETVQSWISLTKTAGRAHERHFHRSLSIDDAFRNDFQRPLDLVLDGVLAALQKRYAAFMKRVETIAAMSNRDEAIDLFETEVPNAPPLQWHFFQKIQSSDWLPLLLKRNLVREPLLDADGSDVTEYGPWPLGHYLLNVAKSHDPNTFPFLVKALRNLKESQHPAVKRFGLDTIAELPATAANDLVDVVIGWLNPDTPDLYYTAPEVILKRLAEGGYVASSLKVAAALFKVFKRGGVIASIHPQHMYEHHLPGAASVLALKDGLAAVCLFSGILVEAAAITDKAPNEDYSYLTPNPLSDDKMANYGIWEALVIAVRNAALLGSQIKPESTPDIIQYLFSQPLKIFTRIAIHVLSKNVDAAPQLAASFLTNADFIGETWCEDEYAELALAYFPRLSAEEKKRILSKVDTLADSGREAYRARYSAHHNTQPTAEDERRYDSAVMQETVWKWRTVLPPERQRLLDESVELLGEPDEFMRRLFPPEISPLTSAEFRAKSMSEIIELLKSFVPSDGPVRQTINAFGQQLRAAVEQEPMRFADAAPECSSLRPIYVRRLLEAFETVATKSEKSLTWDPILSLLKSVFERLANPANEFTQADADDKDWLWCCSTAARLLKTALAQPHTNLKLERAEVIESLITTLFEHAPHEPSAKDFESGFERHPAFTAAQSLWGSAIELCLIFIWWQSRQEGAPIQKEPRQALQLSPHIAALLERSLEDRSTWGRIPRVLLGQRLTWLSYFGKDWLTRHFPALLPDHDESLRRATWLGHLQSDSGPVYSQTATEYLLPSYLDEIDRIGDNESEDSAENRAKRLGDYILLLWIAEMMPEDVLNHFLSRAPGSIRRHSIGYLGRTLQLPGDKLPDDKRMRARRHWETRLAAACSAPNKEVYREELAAIGQWFIHDAANIDLDWLFDQLLTLFRAGFAPNNGYSLIEWLGHVAPSHPSQAVGVLAEMLASPHLNHWTYTTHTAPIRTVLQHGLLADPATAQRSRDVINVLATMAQPGYLDLLETGGNQANPIVGRDD
ncbi:MAG: hypothetical protein WBB34_03560 [Xanthobacteraceae bacterium]